MEPNEDQLWDAHKQYRYLGVRLLDSSRELPAIGSALPNSWHNALDCDWIDENTEIDGTCCFELQSPDEAGLRDALGYMDCCWVGTKIVALIGSNSKNHDAEIPEEGSAALRNPVVLAIWER